MIPDKPTFPEVQAVKRFKCTERFMDNQGFVMERDVFEVILSKDCPGVDGSIINAGTVVALQHGKPRPVGLLTAGKNRKQRRVEAKKAMQAMRGSKKC